MKKRLIALCTIVVISFSIIGCRRDENKSNIRDKIQERRNEKAHDKDATSTKSEDSAENTETTNLTTDEINDTLDKLDKSLDSLDDSQLDSLDSLIENN